MMASPKPAPSEREVELFDRWVLARRQGRSPDLDELLAELPADRREDFRRLLRTTAALQELGREMKARVAEALVEDLPNPTVVEEK